MNQEILLEYIEELKDELKDGLIATSIFNQEDGIAIVEYNTQKESTLAYNDITNYIISKFREHNIENIDKYMIFSLENNNILIIIPLLNYRWAILVDNNIVKLGVLLNMTISNRRKKFKSIL
jgi:hypothetical protein